jgi:hypothetical protein
MLLLSSGLDLKLLTGFYFYLQIWLVIKRRVDWKGVEHARRLHGDKRHLCHAFFGPALSVRRI